MDFLTDAVIWLHDLARYIEQNIGTGNLSQDIRSLADRLNSVIDKGTDYEEFKD